VKYQARAGSPLVRKNNEANTNAHRSLGPHRVAVMDHKWEEEVQAILACEQDGMERIAYQCTAVSPLLQINFHIINSLSYCRGKDAAFGKARRNEL
jgi:hypothetical protein